jgi:mRNA interferase RelE/StbE
VASFRLLIKPSAIKELEAAPTKDRPRIVTRIQGLANEPRPAGSEELTGQDVHRVRPGDYRVVYEISDRERTVAVFKIGHRREVYR